MEFFSAGRFALQAGIACALERRGKSHGVVWLPEYICAEAVSPLRAGTSTLYFYPITKELSPDWPRIHAEAAGASPPDVFILVHYFGFGNCTAEANEFCAAYHAELVEDCAHVLVPFRGCGASTAVFSPRKLLPVPEGGLLVRTQSTGSARAVEDFGSNKAFIAKWVARRTVQRLMLALGASWHRSRKRDSDTRRAEQAEPQGDRVTAHPDRYSRRLLGIVARDFDSIIRKRRDNYLRLLRATAGMEQLSPLFPSLPDHVCPYAFPLIVTHGRDLLNGRLRERGVPSTDWPTLPREVIEEPGVHHIALWLQQHILLLPLHQDLSDGQMEHVAQQLRSSALTKAA